MKLHLRLPFKRKHDQAQPLPQVHIETILGKQVHDADGKPVGHIEEIRVQKDGGDWVVAEYHVGTIALLERFAAMTVADPVWRRLFSHDGTGGYVIPWDKLDLSDPLHPRLLGRKDELKPLIEEH